MTKPDFGFYLYQKMAKDDPYLDFLSNNDPEPFNDWLDGIDIDQIIEWANDYANELLKQGVMHD